jgi:hypothetical protein
LLIAGEWFPCVSGWFSEIRKGKIPLFAIIILLNRRERITVMYKNGLLTSNCVIEVDLLGRSDMMENVRLVMIIKNRGLKNRSSHRNPKDANQMSSEVAIRSLGNILTKSNYNHPNIIVRYISNIFAPSLVTQERLNYFP